MSRQKQKGLTKKNITKQTKTEYEVQKVVDKKVVFGVTYYKVKWLGYDSITWEPAGNLVDNNLSFGAAELVQEFEDNYFNHPTKPVGSNKKKKKKIQVSEEDNNMNALLIFEKGLEPKEEETEKTALPKKYFKAKINQKKSNKRQKQQAIQEGEEQKPFLFNQEENLGTEIGSFTAGDVVDKILGMHAYLTDQGDKTFYCTITWKCREDGTIPLQSNVKSSELTTQNIQLGNLYRKFVEEKYLTKYFLR